MGGLHLHALNLSGLTHVARLLGEVAGQHHGRYARLRRGLAQRAGRESHR
jgi:hypothetical protein